MSKGNSQINRHACGAAVETCHTASALRHKLNSPWRYATHLFTTTSASNVWPYLEDFGDGLAEDFTLQSGLWSVSSGVYEVEASSVDALSILSLPQPLPEKYLVEVPLMVTSCGR